MAESVLETFGKTLVELGEKNEDIVVLEADLMKCSGSEPFMKRFPERHFQIGIQEQNMIAIAAGLALSGKIPFASTFANFASKRALDQVSISVAYNKANVKICGDYAGFTSARNGGTHIAVQDIAIFRSMPNMTVIAPADPIELKKAMEAVVEYYGPVYLRKAKDPMIHVHDGNYEFEIGKADVLRYGHDVALISTGVMTGYALKAADELAKEGIESKVVNMSTIKPLDIEEVFKSAEETKAIVTVENHSILGGLGSAVAEILSEYNPTIMKRVGIRDKFGETATFDWLRKRNSMDVSHIVEAAKYVVEKKS